MAKAPKWLIDLRDYLISQPTSLLVYISLAAFLILWRAALLGVYAVTIGTILGSVAIAISSIGSGSTLDKWVTAGIGTAIVTLCAAMDTSEQVRALTLKSKLEKEVQSYASEPDRKRGFVMFLSGRLHDCVNIVPVDVDHCDDLISLLEHVDEMNGSISYFKAEVFRDRGLVRESDDHLYNYLEDDKRRRPAGEDDGSAAVCDTNGTGYCSQRTAWVCHTLANDLVRRACDAIGSAQRQDLFKRALEMLECSTKWAKGGFEQRLGTRPFNTTDLNVTLDVHLKGPQRPCGAPPKI